MTTPFDAAISAIGLARYHNHRLEAHSDIVSDGIVTDLRAFCTPFRSDIEHGVVRVWKNVSAPGDRLRKIDLFVGEPDADGRPDMQRVRVAIENKSVITAPRESPHRARASGECRRHTNSIGCAARRGVGKAFIAAATNWAQKHGCARLSVTSAEHRADAHAFYPACGLPYTGRRFSVLLKAIDR